MHYFKNKQLAMISPEANVLHNKFRTPEEFKKRLRHNGSNARILLIRMPLYPRVYLNPYYWVLKDLFLTIKTRDIKFLQIAYWRVKYTLVGFFIGE